MNINVIEIMKNQNSFNWYFNNRNCVLLSVLLLLIVTSIYMTKKSLHMIGREKYKEIWSKTVIQTAVIIIVGIGLNAAGMKLKFAINHMPILLFFSAILITAVIQVVECIRFYRNYEEVIKRTNTILIGIIDGIVLLLAIMGRLEVIELVVAVKGEVALQIINSFIDNRVGTQQKYEMGINGCEGDFPIVREEDLFDSRKRQVDNLCQELNKFSGEPFAVAICGDWGSGKTSFINGLKEKMKQAEFVNVECGIERDVKTLLKDISIQIQEIYKKIMYIQEKMVLLRNILKR